MAGRVVLDTNILIAFIKGEARTHDTLKQFDEILVPSIVLGELYYGAFRSDRLKENLARVDRIAADRVVLVPDTDTARVYGELKSALASAGQPIPDNDLWIAAIAIQYDAILYSRDAHFSRIGALRVTTS